MKRQYFIIATLFACNVLNTCLAKPKKTNYRKPVLEETSYTPGSTDQTTDFEEISLPQPSSDHQEKDPQYTPGTFYNEINKSLFTRLFESRKVRGLAEEVMSPFESDKGCNKALGTGDREENTALFSEALKSYIAHDELEKAQRIVSFACLHRVTLSPEATTQAQSFFESQNSALSEKHKELAPIVSEDKSVQSKQASIIAALERLKTNQQ